MTDPTESVDYRETGDVTRVHAVLAREKQEPLTGGVAIPLWLIVVCLVCCAAGGTYLGAFGGGFSGKVYDESAGMEKALPPGISAAAPVEDDPKKMGEKVFTQNCVSCHQPSGLGVPGQYPPLVQSEYVLGPTKRLTAILLKGIINHGPLTVKGQTFATAAMPAWEMNLNDKKLAAVATYIRSTWGNDAKPVSPEAFTSARKDNAAQKEQWEPEAVTKIAGDYPPPAPEGGDAGAPDASAGAQTPPPAK